MNELRRFPCLALAPGNGSPVALYIADMVSKRANAISASGVGKTVRRQHPRNQPFARLPAALGARLVRGVGRFHLILETNEQTVAHSLGRSTNGSRRAAHLSK